LFILELSRLKNPGDFAISCQQNCQPQLIDQPTKESEINILRQTVIQVRDENAIDVGDKNVKIRHQHRKHATHVRLLV